jgi:hypothetical protein
MDNCNDITIDVKEVECEDVGWFKMAQDKIQRQCFVNTVIEGNHLIVASGFDTRSCCWEQRCSSPQPVLQQL